MFFCSGEAHRVSVSEGEEAAVSGGRLRLPSAALLPQVSGADGVCSAHHWARGSAMTEGEDEENMDTDTMAERHVFPNASKFYIYTFSWCMKALELKSTFHNP